MIQMVVLQSLHLDRVRIWRDPFYSVMINKEMSLTCQDFSALEGRVSTITFFFKGKTLTGTSKPYEGRFMRNALKCA